MFILNNIYHGFKLIEEDTINEIGSKAKIFEHEKSGARLLHLENNDDNKVFSITFRTTPTDNTGVPHILEHSVLCGSKKYKIKNVFSDISQSSLKTFLNAITFPDNTTYPISSRNEKDFFNLMDVYLNAVFYPNIYENHDILRQEGWRHEYDEETDTLVYKGVVYSEMQGSLSSPEANLTAQIYSSLFPNTTYTYSSGGDPLVIPNLTQEKFEEFHSKYYHPCNSYIYLYGNQDLDKCLQLINDNYLCNFDKIEIPSKIDIVGPFNEMQEVTSTYSIGADEDPTNKAFLALNFAGKENSDPETYLTLKILYNMFIESSASPIKKALLDNGIGDGLVTYMDMNIDPVKQSFFSIAVNNTDESKKVEFKKVIFNTLKDLCDKGISKDLLKASINTIEFRLRESDPEKVANKGIEYSWLTLHSWLYDASPLNHLKYEGTLNRLKNSVDENYFENFIRSYMLENSHCSLVILNPEAGLASKNSKALKDKLKAYKESLSAAELCELKSRNLKLKERQLRKPTAEEIETVPKLALEDISKEAEVIPQVIDKKDNLTILSHEYNTNKIAYIDFLFDASIIEQEYIPYINLLSCVLGELDTNSKTYLTLNTEIYKTTGGITYSTKVFTERNNCNMYHPKFIIKGKSLINNIPDLLQLINEVLNSTNFNNKQRLKEIIQESKVKLGRYMVNDGDSVSLKKTLASFSKADNYKDCLNGISYYEFLCDIEKNFDKNHEIIKDRLNKVYRTLFNKNNLIISYTGEKEGLNTLKCNLDILLSSLDSHIVPTSKYTFVPYEGTEALVTNSSVQFVTKSFNFNELGYKFSGKMRVLDNILKSVYLHSRVRLQGGAYGCFVYLTDDGNMSFISYRDPNLMETITTYKEAYKFLEELNYSEEDIKNFIIGAIGRLDFPRPSEVKGEIATSRYICNISKEDIQQEREEVLSTTLSDIKAYTDMIKNGMEKNHCVVAGNESKISSLKDIFDKVYYLM